MNTATVSGRHIPKRPPLSSAFASASPPQGSAKKIFFPEDLRQRWEQIISEGRA